MAGRGPPRLIRSPPMNAPDAEGAGLGGSENQTFPLEHIEASRYVGIRVGMGSLFRG